MNNFKLLFIGDIVGKAGREVVKKFLLDDNNKEKYDFIIANGENASHGFGLTKKNHDDLVSFGINCITSGNHIWDKRDIYSYINDSEVLIRPFNYHKSAHGVGYRIFNDKIIKENRMFVHFELFQYIFSQKRIERRKIISWFLYFFERNDLFPFIFSQKEILIFSFKKKDNKNIRNHKKRKKFEMYWK